MGSFLVISCEPVKVETESKIFLEQCVFQLVHHDMDAWVKVQNFQNPELSKVQF